MIHCFTINLNGQLKIGFTMFLCRVKWNIWGSSIIQTWLNYLATAGRKIISCLCTSTCKRVAWKMEIHLFRSRKMQCIVICDRNLFFGQSDRNFVRIFCLNNCRCPCRRRPRTTKETFSIPQTFYLMLFNFFYHTRVALFKKIYLSIRK